MTGGASGASSGAVVSSSFLQGLPRTSLLRLYDPSSQGTSFSLDGFPALKGGKDWPARLCELIEAGGILGMTTNQTLFRRLLETGALDVRLRSARAQGRSAEEIYRILYNEAATEAAQLFRSVHAQWPWEGRVSQEASALLTELEPLVEEVQRIAGAMSGVGAFTKIPNLEIVGPKAIRQATAGGRVNPNVTLVFSDRHYLDAAEGYLLGLQDLTAQLRWQIVPPGQIRRRLEAIHSVNSLFVSRVDRVADPMIDSVRPEPVEGRTLQLLKGKVAVAQAKIVYRIFEAIFLDKPFSDPEGLYADAEGRAMTERIARLSKLFQDDLRWWGATPQRLLIASSGVKSEQPYSPLLYVLPFLGPWCANTLPEATLEELIRFVSGLSDDEAAALRGRNLMAEPLPAIPTDISPSPWSSPPAGGEGRVRGLAWDEALLMTSDQRRQAGIGEISPDRILKEVHEKVFAPRGTTLRAICDDLRDKGAASFASDERTTLVAIESKLSAL